jgi:hypothetical protein
MQRSLVIYAPKERYFNLYINNVLINSQATDEVRVAGLTDNFYNVKVVFPQQQFVVQDNLYIPPLSEISYELVYISPDRFSFDLMDVIPLGSESAGANNTFDWENLTPGISGNINIQIINQNNNQNNTSTTLPPDEGITEVVYVEGYEGDIGCQPPITPDRFQSMLSIIKEQDFDDTKSQIAKQIISSNCMVVSQLVQILQLFNFDDVKLELAKYAFDYIYDVENYYMVNKVFTFDTDKEELNKFIINKGY